MEGELIVIQFYKLKQQLLKALSLTKDRTKLVMVQRVVHKPGVKTFIQTFYVRPDQVQKTDHVIAGHQNLPNNHPQHSLQVKFSKEIKQQTHEFFSKYATTTEAYIALKKLGIGWEHSNSAGKNLIRAKRALNQAIQSGFVISQQSITSADLVDIPSDATPAQKKLAELINKMTDIPTIQKCTVMGIVPEDDVAKDFIIDTLMKKLSNCILQGKFNGIKKSRALYSELPPVIEQNFYKDMITAGLDFPDPSKKRLSNIQMISENLPTLPTIINTSLEQLARQTPVTILVQPHNAVRFKYSKPIISDVYVPPYPQDLIRELNLSYHNSTNDVTKDGFVQVLQRIKQENSTNIEITHEVDRMINKYVEAMSVVPSNLQSDDRQDKLYSLYSDGNTYNTDITKGAGKVYSLLSQMFGYDVKISSGFPKLVGTPPKANQIILTNILSIYNFNNIATTAAKDSDFNYIPYDAGEYPPPEAVTKQLNAAPTYSAQFLNQLQQKYNGTYEFVLKKENLAELPLWKDSHLLADSPLKTILYKNLVALLSFTSNPPKISYDDIKVTEPPPINSQISLKSARQQLFNQAKLSLATESMETSDKMRQDILQNKFDYKPGDTDVLGRVYYAKLYDGTNYDEENPDGDDRKRFALFNSRFFKVNNSIWEERMNTKIQQLKQQYPDHPEYYKVNQGFHGTTYWSAANILGREGEFHIGDNNLTANGSMFGAGVYMGDRLGKSIPYVGNDPYSMLFQESLNDDDADGIAIISDYIFGDKIVGLQGTLDVYNSAPPPDTTCVLAGPSNSKVKAAEIVIKEKFYYGKNGIM